MFNLNDNVLNKINVVKKPNNGNHVQVPQINTQLLVIGAGPGGYTAAFRAADLGQQVVLLEYHQQLGGVCLNVGCIPSKALLHVVHVIEEAKELEQRGIIFNKPKFDVAKLRAWIMDKTINKLTLGLKTLASLRKVQIIQGHGEFINANSVKVLDKMGNTSSIINFKQAIIAVGSRPIELPNLPKDPRIMNSTTALELKSIPDNLLIIGGGIIGMELGTVYSALGSKVSVVELTNQLLPGADMDLVRVLENRIKDKFTNIFLNTKVTSVIADQESLVVKLIGEYTGDLKYNQILCAVGRKPNSDKIGAERIGININEKGFIDVDQQLRTNIPHIFAIGDVIGNPMLAHKALPEGKIAAEVVCGMSSYFDVKVIPSIAYTIPEVSWIGLTEEQCKLQNVRYEKVVFPWVASGRALANGRADGLTKILFNPVNNSIIGAGIVGESSSELIGEIAIAMEMGATAHDLEAIIHPHPTLSETIVQAAELFTGTITDLPNDKHKN